MSLPTRKIKNFISIKKRERIMKYAYQITYVQTVCQRLQVWTKIHINLYSKTEKGKVKLLLFP